MTERYWISKDDRKTWTEVHKVVYVAVERNCGFHNTLGQPDEPATAAFSSGPMHGTTLNPMRHLEETS